jgi:DNA primase
VGEVLAPLVSELIVSPVPQDRPSEMGRYVKSVLSRVQDLSLTRRIGEVRGRMQRIGEGSPGYQEAFAELVALEGERRAHREE